jgi:hypothetical protein
MQATTPSEPDKWDHDPDDLLLHGGSDAMAITALETTRNAIARWTGGIHRPRLLHIGSLHVSPQARWYARTCEGFEKWREGGGFAQDGHFWMTKEHQGAINIDSEDACMD